MKLLAQLITVLLLLSLTVIPQEFTSTHHMSLVTPVSPLQSFTAPAGSPIPIHLERASVELSPEFMVRHPLSVSIVTDEWGMRCGVANVYSGCLQHTGIDFGTGMETGWSAYPTARGYVSFVGAFNGEYPGCGYYAAIYHPDYDTTTIYCHLASPPYVSVGDYVTPTTPIGEVGTTGMSNGIHLHFMTVWGSYYAGPHFDPREWFAQHGITP